ncbi:MAG: hypothetical protein HKM92_14200 [Arenibacter sp.]|nr:hypothetical protein [Arenibacter sp.]
MKLKSLLLIGLMLLLSCKDKPKQKNNPGVTDPGIHTTANPEGNYELHYDAIDQEQATQIVHWLDQGHAAILQFFDSDFKQNFDVYLFSERDSLDKQWQKDWNMPGFKSQCWMVASGIAHRLDILSPRVWETQACEHQSKDTIATQKLIIHELVHVFHGQNNPSPTFENVENIDWLVEGLAVYVSGQLDEDRYERAKTFMQSEAGPDKLADIWKGEHRYGLAGTLVKLIDDTYGRKTLIQLMGHTSADEVLQVLAITEEELIKRWKQSFLLINKSQASVMGIGKI